MVPLTLLILCLCFERGLGRLFHQFSHLPEFAPEHVARRFYETLNNQHLVMVGDSLMRYQYVSLVYLLRYGTFPEMDDHGNLLWEAKFSSYTNFFQQITAALAPNEFCDCHREAYTGTFAPIYENRYYRDESRNITVTSIMYFGDKNDIHGHYRPNGVAGELREEEWRFKEIYTFLEHLKEVASPTPAILMLNAAFHPNYYENATHRERVAKAARQAAPRVIWKTANCPRQRLLSWPSNSFDMHMCAFEGIECLNLEWTCFLNEADFVDPLHFQPPIYSDINIHFLEQLRHSGKVLRYKPLAITNSVVTVTDMEPPATYLVDQHGRLRPPSEAPAAIDTASTSVDKPCVRTTATWEQYNRTTRELLHHIVGDPVWVPCEGTLLRMSNGRSIYLVQGGKLREFQSFGAFVKMGFDTDQVKVVAAEYAAAVPIGEPIY